MPQVQEKEARSFPLHQRKSKSGNEAGSVQEKILPRLRCFGAELLGKNKRSLGKPESCYEMKGFGVKI